MLKLKAIRGTTIFAILVIPVSIYLLMGTSSIETAGILFGIFTYLFFTNKKINAFVNGFTFQVIFASLFIYFFCNQFMFLASILLGVNSLLYYFQIRDVTKKSLDIGVFNLIILSWIIFYNSIEKLRGFNKL